jgi:hypothetical protein
MLMSPLSLLWQTAGMFGDAGKLRWQTAGMFGDAAMAEPCDGVGEAAMAEYIRPKSGLLGGCDAHTGSETSVGTLQAR